MKTLDEKTYVVRYVTAAIFVFFMPFFNEWYAFNRDLIIWVGTHTPKWML